MVTQLKADPKGAFFEIEGHTDNVGDKMINEKLGLERAEAVKRYLYEQHQIPLHKMNVISYGEDKPVAPNKTRDGRAQNRRVVIRVLALTPVPLILLAADPCGIRRPWLLLFCSRSSVVCSGECECWLLRTKPPPGRD